MTISEKSEEAEEEEEREKYVARKLEQDIGSELSSIPLPGVPLEERAVVRPRITRNSLGPV